jgi:hypothetical protein
MGMASATRQQLLYTVSWEAALSFSITCLHAADSAWPANRPFRFAAAVLSGATATLLLCHILPAWIFRELRLPKHRAVTVLKWAAIIWYSAGAMASLCWLVQAEGKPCFWADLMRRHSQLSPRS